MAPEQLHGSDTDARTDIFAFGALIYEMATSRPAFQGKSQASIIAAILEQTPASISTIQPLAPRLLDHVVMRCLAKHSDDRWQTASDLKRELQWVAEGASDIRGREPLSPSRGGRRTRIAGLAGGAALVLASLLTLASGRFFLRPAPDAHVVRFVVSPPDGTSFTQSPASLAVSPDGHSLAFIAIAHGAPSIWLRLLDSPAARSLPGTVGASQPFWSPDSRFLAFMAGGKLKKIDVAGELSQTLADVPVGTQSGAWSGDVILLKSNLEGNLSRVPASGGPAVPITTLQRSLGETLHSWPQFLPDSRHFLYLSRSSQPDHDGVVHLGVLDSSAPTRLFAADSHAVYAAPGYLLYMRGNTLLAQRFDGRQLSRHGRAGFHRPAGRLQRHQPARRLLGLANRRARISADRRNEETDLGR
jgi:hypothetical protein